MRETIQSISQAIGFDEKKCKYSLLLDFIDVKIQVHTNSRALQNKLNKYFAHILSDSNQADKHLYAIESDPYELGLAFEDWKREPGKAGRKDSFVDIQDARVIRKVRTDMLFLQSASLVIAAGPCTDNDNQVINFINSQYMTWLQQRQWLNCHAAALEYKGKGLALAGFSGGGKSTLMLTMLENERARYITNDRLFIKQSDSQVAAKGIAKLPRINPGTIINSERLKSLIPEAERQALQALPRSELWDLEQKYDVHIQNLYGENRILSSHPLDYLTILNWQRHSDQAVTLKRVDLSERADLLAAVMKSPGPFYQYADGHFYQQRTALSEPDYLPVLAKIKVYEATGGVDFQALSQQLFDLLEQA